MWLFKLKRNEQGTVVRHKARLVALGNKQIPGLDFDKTHSPSFRRSLSEHGVNCGYEQLGNTSHGHYSSIPDSENGQRSVHGDPEGMRTKRQMERFVD